MLDHAGFGVSDYERSKAFYVRALAPLGVSLLMEPMGKAAGFGEHGRPFFWIEDRPPAVRGGLHIAFAVDERETVDAFHAAGLAAGGSTTAHPVCESSITRATTAPTSWTQMETTSRRSATSRCSLPNSEQLASAHVDAFK